MSSAFKKSNNYTFTKEGKTEKYFKYLEDPCVKLDAMNSTLSRAFKAATIFAGIPRYESFHLRAPLYCTYAKEINNGEDNIIWWSGEQQANKATRDGQSSSKSNGTNANGWNDTQKRVFGMLKQASKKFFKNGKQLSKQSVPRTLVDETSDDEAEAGMGDQAN